MAWQPSRWTRRSSFARSVRVARLLISTLWTIYRERSRVVRARARARGAYEAQPNIETLRRMLCEFRRTALAHGGLLIKLGQFLSARADLLPPEALAELGTLQDEVPAEPFAEIRAVIEGELGAPIEEVFDSIDPTPAGSASFGQVHRARLRDGRIVAVKVQRPRIEEVVGTDLRTLNFVFGLLRRLSPAADYLLDIRGLYREFSRMVYEELDYEREGHNAERFAEMMRDEQDIVVPAVLWKQTTRRVLTLEWVRGIKVSQIEALDEAGVDRDTLVRRIASLYFKQILEVGFFHADPHPGNIFVQASQEGMRLAFVDFGMVGVITPRMKAGLRTCFGGVVRQDAATIVGGLDELGFLGEQAQREVIEHAVAHMLARYSALPFSQIRNLDPSEVLTEIGAALYDQPVRLPSQLAFLGRAASMLAGLCAMISPEFNLVAVATPFAQQFIRRNAVTGVLALFGVTSVEELGRELLREGISMARSMSALPQKLERVLEHAERGELRLIIESARFGPSLKTRAGRRGAINLLNRPVPVWVPLGMVGAFVTAVMMRRRGAGE
jgi:predicted unusual protein kinase regulating ubiquinone biosynthesis (AarF/ABC1/UbiB family)